MDDPRGALTHALAERIGVPPLSPAEVDAVLTLAGAAAHGTGDRTSAPLACFLAGLAGAGAPDRLVLLAAVEGHVTELAPPAGE